MSLSPEILLVEDEPAILNLLEFTLADKGFGLRKAMNALQARSAIDAKLPDLVILDWMLPGESGVQFARKLRADPRTRALPVIILTAKAEEPDKVMGLESGADDYITKPFSPRELIARVNALLRRRTPELGGERLTVGPLVLDTARHDVRVNDQVIALGAAEFKLLRFLMAHPERVFSRGRLLDQVWGDHAYIEERTVDVHVLRLRKALAEHNAEHLVQTVRGVGYRMTGND
ncbi:MAG: phosphate regulon transcriptional regulatory protein PhoB [Betaproteobacteria bacterium]|nr:phosphate regulon transcriptional regulatory protein PhoB [Betaproteobacteria bacterium]